jgi:hypothetical protein
MPLWGSEYISNFIETVLPAQLCYSNLPFIARDHELEYVFYTSKADAMQINDEVIRLGLKEIASIRFEIIKKSKLKDPYKAYGYAHRKELKTSSKLNQCVYLLNSDIIVSEHFFLETLKKILQGYKVVNIICPRGLKSPIENVLDKKYRNSDNSISIGSQSLQQLWLNNIHPMMNYHFLPKTNDLEIHPATFMWDSQNKSKYVRSFHLHPVVIFPEATSVHNFKNTIDSGVVFHLFKNSEIFTECRYSQYFAVELSGIEKYYDPAGKIDDSFTFNRYFNNNDHLNFHNLNYEITIGSIPELELISLRNQSNLFLSKLLIGYLSRRKSFLAESHALRFVFDLIARFIFFHRGVIPNGLYLHLKKKYRQVFHPQP